MALKRQLETLGEWACKKAKKETEAIIDNPCYHCYTGAIGECALASCKYMWKSWSKDLESEYICISGKEKGCS